VAPQPGAIVSETTRNPAAELRVRTSIPPGAVLVYRAVPGWVTGWVPGGVTGWVSGWVSGWVTG
jgi:hypothetical protein